MEKKIKERGGNIDLAGLRTNLDNPKGSKEDVAILRGVGKLMGDYMSETYGPKLYDLLQTERTLSGFPDRVDFNNFDYDMLACLKANSIEKAKWISEGGFAKWQEEHIGVSKEIARATMDTAKSMYVASVIIKWADNNKNIKKAEEAKKAEIEQSKKAAEDLLKKSKKSSEVPEAAPKIVEGTNIYNFQAPGKRHYYSRLSNNSRVKGITTVIDPSVDVKLDVKLINSGQATKVGNDFHINNRVYGVTSNGELFPRTGEGFYQLDRGAYNGLIILKEYGNTELGQLRMQQAQLNNEAISEALRVYNTINGN